MSNEKRLSDVTRTNSANRVSKFADSILPQAAKQDSVNESVSVVETAPEPVAAPVVTATAEPSATPPAPKAERTRKGGSFTIDDIVNGSANDGDIFNKMVRVTDEHHELLRLMAFKYRKPMNVLVHNLMVLLNQAYQKEQKGESSNV